MRSPSVGLEASTRLKLSIIRLSHEFIVTFIFEHPIGAYDLLEDVFSHVRINSRKWVIQQINVCILVHCPGQRYSLLLSTTQVDALNNREHKLQGHVKVHNALCVTTIMFPSWSKSPIMPQKLVVSHLVPHLQKLLKFMSSQ